MRISIGCDHSALELKNNLVLYLKQLGHTVKDCGTYSNERCDYTDFGIRVAEDIKNQQSDCGIVICFTGIGMSIIANKVKGVRCALIHSVEEAVLTRQHNDSNCLALSAKYTKFPEVKDIVSTWLKTPFSNEERHQIRINKISKYEEEHL